MLGRSTLHRAEGFPMILLFWAAALLLQVRTPEEIIRDLRSGDIEVRAKARSELKKAGKRAIPALERITEDPDPEVAESSRLVLREIREALVLEEAAALIKSGREKQA